MISPRVDGYAQFFWASLSEVFVSDYEADLTFKG